MLFYPILCYSFTKIFQRRFVGSSSLTKGFVAQKSSEPLLSEWTAWIRALLPPKAPFHPQGWDVCALPTHIGPYHEQGRKLCAVKPLRFEEFFLPQPRWLSLPSFFIALSLASKLLLENNHIIYHRVVGKSKEENIYVMCCWWSDYYELPRKAAFP